MCDNLNMRLHQDQRRSAAATATGAIRAVACAKLAPEPARVGVESG
jgi:hypothetical protein